MALDIPTDGWIHVVVTAPLGRAATGNYEIEVTLPRGQVKRVDGIPFGNATMHRLEWLGFISLADAPVSWFLDNLHIEQTKK